MYPMDKIVEHAPKEEGTPMTKGREGEEVIDQLSEL